MTTTFRDKTIYHLRLSELSRLVAEDRRLLRITGRVDLSETNSNELLHLFSDEAATSEISAHLLEHFRFEPAHEHRGKSASSSLLRRHRCLVDGSLLADLTLGDINLHHDLVQFIGYKEQQQQQQQHPHERSDNATECRFKAMYFRLIKRTTLDAYYQALDVKDAYVNRKLASLYCSD